MRKRTLISLILAVVMILAIPGVASADSWEHYFPITVSDNSGATRTMYPIILEVGGQHLVDTGYMTANGTDARLRTTADKNLMLASDNIVFVVDSLPAYGQVTYDLYTGYSPEISAFQTIVGDGGYVTVADEASIELGDNLTIEQSGWWDTSYSTDKNAVYKEGAFKTCITGEEEVSSLIGSDNDSYLDFVATNNDWVQMLDHNDFSFAGDVAFSVVGWANFDAGAINKAIIGKYTGGASYEWRFRQTSSGVLEFNCFHNDASGWVGRLSSNVTAYDGIWTHFAATYDGSETSAGCNIYLNGVDIDISNAESLPYTGMSNTASDLEIGSLAAGTDSNMNGGMAEVKIYARELTPDQVDDDFDGLVSTANLNGWWKFDEGVGNPADSSGKGHNANANTADWVTGFDEWRTETFVTATGVESNEIEVRTDQGEHALDFNGTSDEISSIGGLGAFSFIQNTGIFTILAWVKLDDYTADAGQTIAGNTNASAEKGVHFQYDNRSVVPATSQLRLDINKGVGGDSIIVSYSTTNVITDNKYHYVGVTGDGTNVIFYVDGVAYAGTNTMDAGKSSGDSTRVLAMARVEAAAPTSYWDGQFAEARIYSRTLSPTEVQERYDGTFTDETDLELRFDLNEGTGGTATDTSGNGYNGTLDIVGWVIGMLRIYVDDSLMDANVGVSVPDNSNDWTLYNSNVLPYSDNTSIRVDGTLELWFRPNEMITGTTLPDRATSVANDGTITWGSNDQVSIVFGSVTSYEATVSVASVNVTGFVLPLVGIPDDWWGMEFDGTGLPFYPTFLDTSTETGIPLQTLYLLVVFGAAIALATATIVLTRSVVVGVAFYTVTMAYGANAGIVAWWIIYVFLIMVLGIIFLSSRQAMGG